MVVLPVIRAKASDMRLLTFLLFFSLLTVAPGLVMAGPYSDSAHGSKISGVKRLVTSPQQAPVTGSCAHCHDRKAAQVSSLADGSPLFAPNFNNNRLVGPYLQDDLFCFQCHSSGNSLQQQSSAMGNYDYSRNFGGLPSGGPGSIMDAFNQPGGGVDASYHNLYNIWKYAQKFSRFKQSSSPCSACHNPHRAKNFNKHLSDPAYSSISLPTDPEALWGDQPQETMAQYSGNYQPPLFAGAVGGYEPGGVARAFGDGEQTPDYIRFCLSCHDEPIYSTRYSRNIQRIDWFSLGEDSVLAGDKHGMNSYTQELLMRQPYADYMQQATGYVLSCLDCHEPHGAPNAFLIRRGVNGGPLAGTVSGVASSNSFGYLCRQCHQDDYLAGNSVDSSLVNRWETVHHLVSDRPYVQKMCSTCQVSSGVGGMNQAPIGCFYCHGHGQYVDVSHPGTLPNGRTIPAPEGGVRKTF